MHKLTTEQKDAVREILDKDGIRAMLLLIENFVIDQEQEVLRYNLETGDKEKLAMIKNRSEGARKVFREFSKHLESLKNNKK